MFPHKGASTNILLTLVFILFSYDFLSHDNRDVCGKNKIHFISVESKIKITLGSTHFSNITLVVICN